MARYRRDGDEPDGDESRRRPRPSTPPGVQDGPRSTGNDTPWVNPDGSYNPNGPWNSLGGGRRPAPGSPRRRGGRFPGGPAGGGGGMRSMPMPTLGGGYGGVPPEILERAAGPILGNARGVAPAGRGGVISNSLPGDDSSMRGARGGPAEMGRTFQDRFAGQPGGPTLGGKFPPQARGGRMGGSRPPDDGFESWLQEGGFMLPQDFGPGSANERARAALRERYDRERGGGPPSGPIMAPPMAPPRMTHADILARYADQMANRPAGIPQGPPRPGPIGPPTPGPGGVGLGPGNVPPPIPMPYNVPPIGVGNELPPSPSTNSNPFPMGGGPGGGGGVNPHPGPVGPPQQQPPQPTPIGVGNQRPPGPQGPPTTPPWGAGNRQKLPYQGPPINPNNQLGQPQPPEADAFAAWMRSRGQ